MHMRVPSFQISKTGEYLIMKLVFKNIKQVHECYSVHMFETGIESVIQVNNAGFIINTIIVLNKISVDRAIRNL